MSVNIETAIAWFTARIGKVTYSMTHRDGAASYDCSSSLYYALREAGASRAAWAVSTETAHDWLTSNGFQLLAVNKNWDMQRGDVIIWGRKGQSAGSGGHAMLAIDANRIIHCSYGYNGINVNNYNQYYGWNAGTMGGPYVYVYRLKSGATSPNPSAKTSTTQKGTGTSSGGVLERLAGETMAGKHGRGDSRKAALGSKYAAVQTIINERFGVIDAQTSHQRLADEVLAGKLGNGAERRENLGTYYNAVQAIINRR